MDSTVKKHIAVVGSGAAGLSAAWLLAKRHTVTLLEQDGRLGGHANTVATNDPDAPDIDTGFIVFNNPCYPNFIRWMDSLGVAAEDSNMSFAVSRDSGQFEYAGGPAAGLLAQPSIVFKPRFWRMLRDLVKFYKLAPRSVDNTSGQTLGAFLAAGGYSKAFIDDHLMPFAAAVWSADVDTMLDYPVNEFIRFCDNHGLLQLRNRPQWRTLSGGSQSYVNAVAEAIGFDNIKTNFDTVKIERLSDGVVVHSRSGRTVRADHVVVATHADQALALLETPNDREQALLSQFKYETNTAYLHTDASYMPKRRAAWCSWNYVEAAASSGKVCVSYWMNLLQNFPTAKDYFVTLNPAVVPDDTATLYCTDYDHPVFNQATASAQKQLWSLQGRQRTWFCGSYFGAGFHEDAVQAGLAVAEQLGEVSRPWHLDNPSSRIVVKPLASDDTSPVAA